MGIRPIVEYVDRVDCPRRTRGAPGGNAAGSPGGGLVRAPNHVMIEIQGKQSQAVHLATTPAIARGALPLIITSRLELHMNGQLELFDKEPDPWQLDAAAATSVAKVVFPSAPVGEFDYLIPDALRGQLKPGARVRVPLGRSPKPRLAYCVGIGAADHAGGRLKPLHSIVDPRPLVTDDILRLSSWIADYYMCDLGTVLETVIPASVRGKAGTRNVTYLSPAPQAAGDLAPWKLSAKQQHVMHILKQAVAPMTPAALATAADCTSAPITALRKKGLIAVSVRREFQEEFPDTPPEPEQEVELNQPQREALEVTIAALDRGQHEVVLLYGITGSGKTEVYIRAIEHAISFGRQAIVLVPEISLTPQTRRRFRARFPAVAVLHSHMNAAERHAEWQRIVSGNVQVVVGARSAVFAPLPHLGLIVIDEEHESSFKQESAPRYHAREVAARRAAQLQIPLVLGSATPSLESWYRAQQGEYRLVRLPARVQDRPLPPVGVVDLREEILRGASRHSAISARLGREIAVALKDRGQVILLLNRRGFATHIQCPSCGIVVRCPDCDIALTHHREAERAMCHYCNFQMAVPDACPECRFTGIRFGGYGTQRLEEEVRRRFPQARLQRMDTDTMRAPGSHEEVLDRFRRHQIDILLGTQMIAKGLDFPDVTLVGVINADTALHFADFRAAERTFQLVTQVAGRTGRGSRLGKVLVQSFSPDHPAIRAAAHQHFERFAEFELPQRKQFFYPPFASLVRLVFRGASSPNTEAFADQIKLRLAESLASVDMPPRLLGPAAAPIGRLRGKYRFHILMHTTRLADVRNALRGVADAVPTPKDVEWIVDVDPISML